MSQNLLLLVLEVLYYISIAVSVGILIPQKKYACPGEKVVFTCQMDQGINILCWRIEFMEPSVSSIRETFIVNVNHIGVALTDTNNIGQSFVFNLTSTSPLTSTLTTTILETAMPLQEILITCEDGSAIAGVQATSIIRIIMEGSYPYGSKIITQFHSLVKLLLTAPFLNSTMTITTAEHSENGTLIQLSWIESAATALYHVEVLPADPRQTQSLMSNDYHDVTTSNTSLQLWLKYNEEFNITILASNCAGNSTPIESTYKTGKLYYSKYKN